MGKMVVMVKWKWRPSSVGHVEVSIHLNRIFCGNSVWDLEKLTMHSLSFNQLDPLHFKLYCRL